MTDYTNISKNSTSHTLPSRSDYEAESTAKLSVMKLSVSKLSKDSDFTFYTKPVKNTTTYENPTKN